MLTFQYTIKNNQSSTMTGTLQAENRDLAIKSLKQKGYFIINVQQQSKAALILNRNTTLLNRISTKDKAIFTHQLAALLKAGMRLTLALKTLTSQTENKALCLVISQLHDDIEQSSSLSEAMEKHPTVFPQVYTAIIHAAEHSGSLAETLDVLAKQLKSDSSVSMRIKGAMIYPLFLFLISALVVSILITFVIPKFITLFVNANQALPLPTKLLISAAGLFNNYWWLLAFLIAFFASIAVLAFRNPSSRFLIDSFFLKMPLMGKLNKLLELARFTRTLGSLLKGGVMALTAIKITVGTTNNSAFAAEILNIHNAVVKGCSFAQAMREQYYFNEITANMTAVGEETGNLPEMLLDLADIYDQESEAMINGLTTLLGPLMIVILGLIIGFVVLAILMPIFETSTIVG